MSRLAVSRRAGIAAIAAVAIQATLALAAVADPSTLRPALAEDAVDAQVPALLAASVTRDTPAIASAGAHVADMRNAAVAESLTTGGAHARHGVQSRKVAQRADVFATVDGLDLHLTGERVAVIGFHEANIEHLTMSPRGTSRGNLNAGPTPPLDTDGHDFVIMPSRAREGSPTSAVDLVMPAGDNVLAPVSGRVVKVADYVLYDEFDDSMIQIVPDDRPDLIITLFHVSGVRVRHGQQITAGETVIANSARVFDFIAQVEQWGRGPHVDLRVHRA